MTRMETKRLAKQYAIEEDSVMSRQVGDEWVLLDLKQGIYFGLKDSGGRIWKLLTQRKHTEQIMRTLKREFDAPSDEIEMHVGTFIQSLNSKGLIRAEKH